MSKIVKQMQMDALKHAFGNVRDMVVLSVNGLGCQADNQLRNTLRSKKINLMLVKNSLARRAFNDLGMAIEVESSLWQGSTVFAWGGSSVAELSRTLDGELRNPKVLALYKDRIIIKGAIAEGQLVSFEEALKMPTRVEAIGRVLGLILAPATRLLSQITGPGSQVASQIKNLGEKEDPQSEPLKPEDAEKKP
jgi:large subunit ribosomal protein L10